MTDVRFVDRTDAGRRLATALAAYAGRPDLLVLALPRGGVPVAFEVAEALHAPLDVFLVRKLGVPGQEELAMGAIASGGIRVLNRGVLELLPIPPGEIDRVAEREQRELERREREYRGTAGRPRIGGRTVILVDDGLATGATMRAAVAALRAEHPARIVVAVPVAARETCDALRAEVDDVVCVLTPEPFHAVGLWYQDFSQTTDEEVRALLARPRGVEQTAAEHGGAVARVGEAVRVAAGAVELEGDLVLTPAARGVVLFAHGSGSSRHSSRNRYVARELQSAGLATLLIDLLTATEEAADARGARLRFDIALLAERLAGALEWLGADPRTGALPVGLFGASTGGGAALVAAADRPDRVGAVVSRGGRPDLAGAALPRVRAPTLLIVGGEDGPVIGMNRDAMSRMTGEVRLEIVPRATHLFEEPGALEAVARLAREWFLRHLGR